MTVHTRALAAFVAMATLLLAGCIGATDRSDFDAEVRRRGGGITTDWIAHGLDLVATELAVPTAASVEVLTMSINPSNRSLTVQGRRGDSRDFVDTVTVVEGVVVAVTPLQDADDLPLDDLVLAVSELPIDDIEALSDDALRSLGEADGFVSRIAINIIGGAHEVRVSVASARQTGDVVFDLDGNLVEVDT